MNYSADILELIRNTVREGNPNAEIYLFGSRARGTHKADSDWDILVLIDTPKLTPSQKSIDYELWSKGLEYGEEINTVIRTVDQWKNNTSLFKHNVIKDSIRL